MTPQQTAELLQVREIQVSYKGYNHQLPAVRCGMDAESIFRAVWNPGTIELYEEIKVLLLDNALNVLGVWNAGTGGIAAAYTDLRLILAVALQSKATRIVLAHNHPSGNLTPSGADKQLTEQIKAAALCLNIQLLDHLILTVDKCLSFEEEGIL